MVDTNQSEKCATDVATNEKVRLVADTADEGAMPAPAASNFQADSSIVGSPKSAPRRSRQRTKHAIGDGKFILLSIIAGIALLAVVCLALAYFKASGGSSWSAGGYSGSSNSGYNYNYNFTGFSFSVPYRSLTAMSRVNWAILGQVLRWLGLISAVLGSAFWAYAVRARRRYIHLDKIGLLISDSPNPGEGDARFIPWGCLTDVEVVSVKDRATAIVASAGTDQEYKVVFHVDDGSLVQVSWRDIVACTESGAFVNSLKTFAPYAIQNTIFPGTDQITQIDNNTYTQLWFKYYSKASERQRTGYLSNGDTLQEGRYVIAGQLGGGGQGMAYLATDTRPEPGCPTEVVLKEYILPVHRGQQVLEAAIEKLHREAQILKSINHPNIVRFFSEFTEDQRGYLVMEYVAGKSLKQLVVSEGPQPEEFVSHVALQASDILNYLHSMSPPVVHRDITPDNLILEETGLIKLVDFNVAQQLESTATATVVGKHCFIPPEQFRGKPTPQSDIYALGGTLFYLVTGQEPEPLTVSHPKQLRPELSDALDDLIAQCTTLDAAFRLRNAAELRSRLTETCVQKSQ